MYSLLVRFLTLYSCIFLQIVREKNKRWYDNERKLETEQKLDK